MPEIWKKCERIVIVDAKPLRGLEEVRLHSSQAGKGIDFIRADARALTGFAALTIRHKQDWRDVRAQDIFWGIHA